MNASKTNTEPERDRIGAKRQRGVAITHFREKVVLLSILLHLLVFLLWENAAILGIFTAAPKPPPPSPPLVLDLQPPAEPENKRVIESPADAQIPQPPQKAEALSDRNARAQNPEVDESKPLGDTPYSRGDIDSFTPPPSPEPTPSSPLPSQPAADQRFDKLLDTESIVRDSFNKQLQEQTQASPSDRERIGVSHQQLAKRVKDMGGLAFNTYNWDFAPYMLRLKALIEQNIHPPYAFSHLGLIEGATILRFKIFPDGVLRDLEVLDYKGHRTLMETSTAAIQISAPFPDLPKNFPEPYLEVTGKFIYMIQR